MVTKGHCFQLLADNRRMIFTGYAFLPAYGSEEVRLNRKLSGPSRKHIFEFKERKTCVN